MQPKKSPLGPAGLLDQSVEYSRTSPGRNSWYLCIVDIFGRRLQKTPRRMHLQAARQRTPIRPSDTHADHRNSYFIIFRHIVFPIHRSLRPRRPFAGETLNKIRCTLEFSAVSFISFTRCGFLGRIFEPPGVFFQPLEYKLSFGPAIDVVQEAV